MLRRGINTPKSWGGSRGDPTGVGPRQLGCLHGPRGSSFIAQCVMKDAPGDSHFFPYGWAAAKL